MTGGSPKNMAASVHQRLLNQARQTGRPFNELLQYFALERFLYRLSVSPHAKKFLLKGAMMLRAWRVPLSRPTMDIDLLGRTANQAGQIAEVFRAVCGQTVEPDGLVFDPATITSQAIAEDAEYEGVRVTFKGHLGNARIMMQIDIGFGDVIRPGPAAVELPTLLDFPVPKLLGYTRESSIAEKFHAMVKRAQLNSRMKDFYDIWLLSRRFDFDGAALADAIKATFANRDTPIPADTISFAPAFATDAARVRQWQSFLRKLPKDAAPADFGQVVQTIGIFLQPVASAIHAGASFNGKWTAPGPWGA